ncbi:MAG: GGDEF domain-containing protein [Selenomonas sp.]|uniref:GGDEF domain-containing protein n=1 Tax=Selenomonas sp. TaxID=2053611 RepID=UPI0025CB8CD1|nr:GGDEF domain-containing protein [Selenomonas sp.]MCR5756696.1 GGDEF domain-containing protein [Selenomonas sp.]
MVQPNAFVPDNFTPVVYEALESADNIIFFQWNLSADTFKIRDNSSKHRYALPNHFSRASTRLTLEGLVHPDDAGMLEHYLHHIYHDRPHSHHNNQSSARLRLRSSKKPLWLWSEVHLVTYYRGQHPAMAFGSIRNIQAEKLWQERITRRANTDALTGLLSKCVAQSQIRTALRHMSSQQETATLLIIDADDFKSVNDTFGHIFGDKVLREVGQAIVRNFRQSDIKGRIGGDEFIILLPGMNNQKVLARHCHNLCRRLSRVFHGENGHQAFSISIGAAQFPCHGQSYQELFAHADQALYEAKRRGKSQYVLYQPDMSETIKQTVVKRPEHLPVYGETVSIPKLQAKIEQMQQTIDSMEQLMHALLAAKSN